MSVRRRVAVLSLSLCFPLLLSLLLFDAVNGGRVARAAPAAPIVDTLIDENDGSCEDGDCSLRDAINTTNSSGKITFSVSGTIIVSPTLGDLDIDKDLTIDGGGMITVSGDNAVRVFNVTDGNVTFDNLTIANGNVQTDDCGDYTAYCGGGIILQTNGVAVTVTNSTLISNSAEYGGGIFNDGTVTVTNSTLSGNSAEYIGGGIFNWGTVTVGNSTLSGNSAGDHGGGIHNEGTVTVGNSTLSGNSAGYYGGGISGFGTVTVTNSTLSGNSADFGGGINNSGNVTINNSTLSGNSAGTGGGIASYGASFTSTTISNTIVSGNVISGTTTADDLALYAGTTNSFTSGGYNLIGAIGDHITFAGTGDQTGVTDPKLGPLADNGGDTFTHALLPNSLAIDNGECSSGPAADQRGVARSQDDNCDIGAYEEICAMTVVNDHSNGPGSLREKIATVCPEGLITFDSGLANHTIDISPDGQLLINRSMTISGTVPVTVSGSNKVRVFNVMRGSLTLDSLTIAHGNAQTLECGSYSESCGGGIALQNSDGAVMVTNSTLFANSADYGGGIMSLGGTVTVTKSTFSDNSADYGGGINNTFGGTASVSNSTLSGNSADYGGGIYNTGSGSATIINSTLTDNRAGTGGGITTHGASDTTTTIARSIISGNVISGTTTADDLALAFGTTNGFSSGGYNLIGTIGDNINFAGPGDQAGVTNPLLGPLAANGGETMTHALLPGSRAIDAGVICGVATDQRGIARPKGIACDTGAFESRGFSLTQSGGSPQTTAVNTPFANPLSLTASSAFNEPVAGGQVTFSAPASGASLTFTETLATINSSGAASLPVTANGKVGSYQVKADALGSSGPGLTYKLTNSLHHVFLPVLIK